MGAEPLADLVSLRHKKVRREQRHNDSDKNRGKAHGKIAGCLYGRRTYFSKKITQVRHNLLYGIIGAQLDIQGKSGEKRIQALSDTVQIGFHALPHFGKRSHQSHSLLQKLSHHKINQNHHQRNHRHNDERSSDLPLQLQPLFKEMNQRPCQQSNDPARHKRRKENQRPGKQKYNRQKQRGSHRQICQCLTIFLHAHLPPRFCPESRRSHPCPAWSGRKKERW